MTEATYSRDSRDSWKPTQAKLKALRATEWPAAPLQPHHSDSTTSNEANLVLWDKATRAQRLLANGPFGNDRNALREHFYLVAVRFTRILATLSRSILPQDPLSTVPSRPDGWTVPLPQTPPESPLSIPQGLTLSPFAYSDAAQWIDVLSSASPNLTTTTAGPTHFLIQYLEQDPQSLHVFWPSPQQLVRFEEELIELVSRKLKKHGRQVAHDFLTRRLDFTQHEAAHFLVMALAVHRDYARMDQDTARGLIMARTEDFTRRAKKALDLKAEYNGLKLQASILGLTRGESNPEDDKDVDFREVVARVTNSDGPPKFKIAAAPAAPVEDTDAEDPDTDEGD